MSQLGTLTLDLVARIGGYEQGLDKAEREAKKRAAAIEKAFDSAFSTITAGFALVASAGAAALAAVNSQANSIANYQDLAEKVGDTAVAFASLQLASTVSGVAMDTVAAASIKLTASLSKTDDEAKTVGQAIKAIGLEFDSFKKMSPVDQIEAVANALGEFEDGAEKTAIAVALFGKSGAELLPFLNDLADGSERQTKLTEEQIKAADEYTKATARLKAQFDQFVQQQSAGLIPVLTEVQAIFAELAKNEAAVEVVTTSVNVAVKAAIIVLQTLAVVASDVGFVFLSVGREIGAWTAQLAALARLDLKGFRAISDAVKEDGARARAELDKFQARVMSIGQPLANTGFGSRASEDRGFTPTKRRIDISGLAIGPKGPEDDPAKKLLENELKEFERIISQERDLLGQRNKFLDLYNSQGLISIKDYYASQNAILSEATQKQSAAYDAQIAALEKYRATLKKQSDIAETDGKIAETREKQAKLLRDAGATGIEATIKQQVATKAYSDAVNELNAKLLELNGNLAAAAAIRFDAQNFKSLQTFTAEGNVEAQKALSLLREYTIAQAQLNKLQQDFSLTMGDLQIEEERITIARQRGTMGEIESLKASGDARRRQYALLSQQISQFEELRRVMQLNPEQLQQYERLKLQFEQLGATLDPLADKIDTTFSNAFGDAFADIVTGSKSAAEAFRNMGNVIVNTISRMIAESWSKQLFAGLFGGSGGGIGGFFSGLLGGGSFLGGLFGGGGGFGTGAAFGNMDFGGFFADGGYLGAGKWGIAGENGPELIRGPAQVVPASQTTNRNQVNNISVMVPAMTDRRTAGQIGSEVSRRLQQANFRNN